MSRKGKPHETQAAEVIAEPVVPAVPAEHDEPAAEALVAGDGGDAAGAGAEQHQGEPAGSLGHADSIVLGDGAEGKDAETEGQAEEGLAQAALLESDGVNDDAGEQHQSPPEVSAEQAFSGDAGTSGAGPDGHEPGAAGDEGSAGAGEGFGEQLDPQPDAVDEGDREGGMAVVIDGDDGSDTSGEGPAGVRNGDVSPAVADVGDDGRYAGAPSGDNEPDPASDDSAARDDEPVNDIYGIANGTAPPRPTLDQVALCGAVGAYQEALVHGAWLAATIHGTDVLDPRMTDAVYDDMAAFVRQIGERATPDVLAQHLVIKKHRASAEISAPERIAFSAFSSVLLGLDRYLASERECIARENAVAEPRPPVPVDETTMELVDAPMATWGNG